MTEPADWQMVPDLDPEDLVGEDIEEEGGETEDLAALKNCLQALADAVGSTNLAVLQGAQGDVMAATARVQASVAALKRFADAFKVLKGEDEK